MNKLERAVYENFIGFESQRKDIFVPRNGSRTYSVQLLQIDGVTPVPLTAAVVSMKTSYESSQPAVNFVVTDLDPAAGTFKFTAAPSSTRGLGIDCTQCVYDAVITPSGQTQPKRIMGGLVTLSKGVSVSS